MRRWMEKSGAGGNVGMVGNEGSERALHFSAVFSCGTFFLLFIIRHGMHKSNILATDIDPLRLDT